MKQKTVKFVGSSNSYTHTHTKLLRVVKFCVIMAMFLSYSYQAKSQSNGYDDQIVGPASAVENQIVNYATAAYVQQSNCHPVWTISGGTIIGSATSHNIAVKWLNGGTTGTLSFSTWGCTGVQVACCQVLEVSITNYVPPPITISGRVANPCGVGIQGVAIQGFPTSVATDYDGYYSVTVPYAWTGVVSASLSPFSFSPSQSVVNTTANRTLNFMVNAGSLTGASLSVTKGFSPLLGTTFTIGGMIPGYSYIYSYTYNDGSSSTGNITPATNSIEVYQVTNGLRFCIQVACGGSMPVCSN